MVLDFLQLLLLLLLLCDVFLEDLELELLLGFFFGFLPAAVKIDPSGELVLEFSLEVGNAAGAAGVFVDAEYAISEGLQAVLFELWHIYRSIQLLDVGNLVNHERRGSMSNMSRDLQVLTYHRLPANLVQEVFLIDLQVPQLTELRDLAASSVTVDDTLLQL